MLKQKFSLSLTALLLAIIALQGCKQPEFQAVGTPFSAYKGIQGTYKLKKVIQDDRVTSDVNTTLDVSDLYVIDGGTPMQITFADSMVSLNLGDTPVNYSSLSSTPVKWHFDDAVAPSYVLIPNAGGVDSLKLLNPVREPFDKNLNVVLKRYYTNPYDGTKKLAVNYQFFLEE